MKFNVASRVFQGSLKGVSRKFLDCFKEVSMVSQETGSFKWGLKEVQREFQGSFKHFISV